MRLITKRNIIRSIRRIVLCILICIAPPFIFDAYAPADGGSVIVKNNDQDDE